MSPDPWRRFDAIILAAQRQGRVDPLADAAGVSHKALVPISGRPLLAHVLQAFAGVAGVARIRVSAELDAWDTLREAAAGDTVEFSASRANITDSLYAAAEGLDGPFVVTTADNVLLTPEAVRRVVDRLHAGDDAVGTLARKQDVLAAHPHGQRRFYRFSDGEFSNCNLYGLSQRGLGVAETFRSGGQFAKKPLRIVQAVGLINLVILRFGLISLDEAFRRLGRRFGVKASPVLVADGAHAIDVDNERTFVIASHLLERRQARS
ncbi:MAG: NTP transferase domain-containing protein [Sphingosinicella sp.]